VGRGRAHNHLEQRPSANQDEGTVQRNGSKFLIDLSHQIHMYMYISVEIEEKDV
jgi:hypothetical protein